MYVQIDSHFIMKKANFRQIFHVVEYMYSNDFAYKIPVKLFSQFNPEIPEIVFPYSINIHTERLRKKIKYYFQNTKNRNEQIKGSSSNTAPHAFITISTMRHSSKLKTGDIKTFKLIILIRMKTLQVASKQSRTNDVVPNGNILVSKFCTVICLFTNLTTFNQISEFLAIYTFP